MNDNSYTPLNTSDDTKNCDVGISNPELTQPKTVNSQTPETQQAPDAPPLHVVVSHQPLPHPSTVGDSLELVQLHMDAHGLTAGWHRVFTHSGEYMDYATHEDDLILWAQKNGVPKRLYGQREMGAAYRKIQREQYHRLICDIASSLSEEPETSGGSWDFSRMADTLGWSEVDALCMIWWMKDRKRALLELARGRTPEMRQVPMPVLYSRKQKTGKSFFIERLCEPFDELCEVKNISEIEDKFNFLQWGKLLIANFDEMAGLDKTDMNLLKQWAFQKKFTKRKMQSEQQNHIYKTAAGIGSSNDPIEEIVWDSTGTRRFCQINVITDGRYVHAARTIDFINVWRSIDHTTTLSDVEQDLIYQEQDKQRRRDKVEHWFEESGRSFMVGKNNGVTGVDLYANFMMWCNANGEKPYTNTLFGRRIKAIFDDQIEVGRKASGMIYALKE